MIYSSLVVISTFIKGAVKVTVYGADNFADNFFAAEVTALDAVISMVAATIPSRVARQERDLSLYLLTTKKQFIRFLANEYRHSLNTIITGVDLAKSTVQSYCDPYLLGVLRLLANIRYSCDMACGLLDNVVLVDELKDNALTLSCVEQPVFSLINEAVLPLEQVAKHAKVDLQYKASGHVDPSLRGVMAYIDKLQLIQALRNLVFHAIKVTPSSEKVEIFAFARRGCARSHPARAGSKVYAVVDEMEPGHEHESQLEAYDAICIEIHDRGPGVPEEKWCDLFEGNLTGSHKSKTITVATDLGLYVAQNIIHLHGGKIGVFSEEDRGCIFSVEIPVSSVSNRPLTTYPTGPDDAHTHAKIEEEPMLESGSSLSTTFLEYSHGEHGICIKDVILKRALVISGSSNTVNQICNILEAHTTEVVTMDNYPSAMHEMNISIRDMRPFNIVFFDSAMAGVNVLDMVSRFRKNGYVGIAVLVTDENFPDTNEKFKFRGGQHVFMRPLNANDVERALVEAYQLMLKSSMTYLTEQALRSLSADNTSEEIESRLQDMV
eukprot:CAMPEP_0185034368 /NCGR_PEP_ID=MMETSP1103-20130426/24194_1 /TAXON_ID=36769 /ORGANISM="Paraphysomonas bandaiensis, Strain Caron Lab Isolate" /LENGTH=549 /DNA_ID=CAMNT_0027570999 /DNA_START=752 /DNA_END=2401 /DNA_ORIENTATION=+